MTDTTAMRAAFAEIERLDILVNNAGFNRPQPFLDVDDTTLDRIVRKARQAHFGRALEAGAKIYEYGPALLHAKTMVVDGRWITIGSANLDNRSFQLNNELNVAFLDKGMAARMTEIFQDDLKYTRPVTYKEWQRHALRHAIYLPLIRLRDQL